jgi:hypothetical protein
VEDGLGDAVPASVAEDAPTSVTEAASTPAVDEASVSVVDAVSTPAVDEVPASRVDEPSGSAADEASASVVALSEPAVEVGVPEDGDVEEANAEYANTVDVGDGRSRLRDEPLCSTRVLPKLCMSFWCD